MCDNIRASSRPKFECFRILLGLDLLLPVRQHFNTHTAPASVPHTIRGKRGNCSCSASCNHSALLPCDWLAAALQPTACSMTLTARTHPLRQASCIINTTAGRLVRIACRNTILREAIDGCTLPSANTRVSEQLFCRGILASNPRRKASCRVRLHPMCNRRRP